jgi:hypothetical protein
MTQEDIIRMAREAGMAGFDGTVHAMFQLEAFATLVAEAEREECAKVCESMRTYVDRHNAVIQSSATDCAAAIRARGQA